jgi:hypothetical protein
MLRKYKARSFRDDYKSFYCLGKFNPEGVEIRCIIKLTKLIISPIVAISIWGW